MSFNSSKLKQPKFYFNKDDLNKNYHLHIPKN